MQNCDLFEIIIGCSLPPVTSYLLIFYHLFMRQYLKDMFFPTDPNGFTTNIIKLNSMLIEIHKQYVNEIIILFKMNNTYLDWAGSNECHVGS